MADSTDSMGSAAALRSSLEMCPSREICVRMGKYAASRKRASTRAWQSAVLNTGVLLGSQHREAALRVSRTQLRLGAFNGLRFAPQQKQGFASTCTHLQRQCAIATQRRQKRFTCQHIAGIGAGKDNLDDCIVHALSLWKICPVQWVKVVGRGSVRVLFARSLSKRSLRAWHAINGIRRQMAFCHSPVAKAFEPVPAQIECAGCGDGAQPVKVTRDCCKGEVVYLRRTSEFAGVPIAKRAHSERCAPCISRCARFCGIQRHKVHQVLHGHAALMG